MSKKKSKASKARKPKTKLLTVNAKNCKGKGGNLSRARYVLAYLQTSNKQFALRVSQLSNNAHDRVVRIIAKNGHFADGERSGHLALYTEAEMEAAYNALTNQPYGRLNEVELLSKLKEEGLVHKTAEPKKFLQHLIAHVKSHRRRLITYCTKTTFFISKADAQARVL